MNPGMAMAVPLECCNVINDNEALPDTPRFISRSLNVLPWITFTFTFTMRRLMEL